MEIWPAIDLRGGKCVRLKQGDYARETVFGDDPAAMARHGSIRGPSGSIWSIWTAPETGDPVNLAERRGDCSRRRVFRASWAAAFARRKRSGGCSRRGSPGW